MISPSYKLMKLIDTTNAKIGVLENLILKLEKLINQQETRIEIPLKKK
jgi:hypothetical protein